MRMNHVRNALQLLGFAIILGILGCQAIPKVHDHFNRNSPLETVRFFRYCVDAGEYRLAYESLTAETQKQVSELQFNGLVRFVDVPELDGLGLRDLIVKSKVDPVPEHLGPGTGSWWVTLIWESADQYIEYSLRLVPLQGSDIAENPHWRLDLLNPRGLDFGGSGP